MNKMEHITVVYFSPTGGTRKACLSLAMEMGKKVKDVDLCSLEGEYSFGPEDTVIVGVPVFGGRIPGYAAEKLTYLKGGGAAAVTAAVYGNRAFEDALLELADLLKSRRFVLAGAAAAVAQHSIFPAVAAGRPDAADIEKLHSFAASAAEKIRLAAGPEDLGEFPIPGNHPYRKLTNVPMHPRATSACIQCGTCASVCPTGAIPLENGRITDRSLCISCTACIKACPVDARGFGGPVFAIGSKLFAHKCAQPRQPEFFL